MLAVAKVCDVVHLRAPTMMDEDKPQTKKDTKNMIKAAHMWDKLDPGLNKLLDKC